MMLQLGVGGWLGSPRAPSPGPRSLDQGVPGCRGQGPAGADHPILTLPPEDALLAPGKALLEEEALTSMVPVISAASTHLSPE